MKDKWTHVHAVESSLQIERPYEQRQERKADWWASFAARAVQETLFDVEYPEPSFQQPETD